MQPAFPFPHVQPLIHTTDYCRSRGLGGGVQPLPLTPCACKRLAYPMAQPRRACVATYGTPCLPQRPYIPATVPPPPVSASHPTTPTDSPTAASGVTKLTQNAQQSAAARSCAPAGGGAAPSERASRSSNPPHRPRPRPPCVVPGDCPLLPALAAHAAPNATTSPRPARAPAHSQFRCAALQPPLCPRRVACLGPRARHSLSVSHRCALMPECAQQPGHQMRRHEAHPVVSAVLG